MNSLIKRADRLQRAGAAYTVWRVRELLGPRRYKTAIHTAWMSGDYEGNGLGELAGPLQTVRNLYGPSWLHRLRLPAQS